MNTDEKERVEGQSDWYLSEQLDFDKRLVNFRYETLRPYLNGAEGLELGPADGSMTGLLVKDFKRLTVVDGSSKLLNTIPDAPNLVKRHTLFEDFEPVLQFDTIIMEHILEHVDQPVTLLHRVKNWIAQEGNILIGVPNGNSIHRLVAVKMGLLGGACELNNRDIALGHRRIYTPETLRNDIELAGLEIVKMGGVFFKPLSNQQIQDNWSEEMIRGFYELGRDFPDYAAELYAVCRL